MSAERRSFDRFVLRDDNDDRMVLVQNEGQSSPVMVRVLRALTPGGSRIRSGGGIGGGGGRAFQVVHSGYGEVRSSFRNCHLKQEVVYAKKRHLCCKVLFTTFAKRCDVSF